MSTARNTCEFNIIVSSSTISTQLRRLMSHKFVTGNGGDTENIFMVSWQRLRASMKMQLLMHKVRRRSLTNFRMLFIIGGYLIIFNLLLLSLACLQLMSMNIFALFPIRFMENIKPWNVFPIFSNHPVNDRSNATPLNTMYSCGSGWKCFVWNIRLIVSLLLYCRWDSVGGLYVGKFLAST